MRHLKKELSMENLLFITIMLQWQDYLITNELWDSNNSKCRYAVDATRQLRLPENVPPTAVIKQLKDYDRDQVNVHGDDSHQFNYSVFVMVFDRLYKQYIERQRAPYEINIDGDMRDKIKSYYQKIIDQNKGKMDEQVFWNLWYDLTIVCQELEGGMLDSLLRCQF